MRKTYGYYALWESSQMLQNVTGFVQHNYTANHLEGLIQAGISNSSDLLPIYALFIHILPVIVLYAYDIALFLVIRTVTIWFPLFITVGTFLNPDNPQLDWMKPSLHKPHFVLLWAHSQIKHSSWHFSVLTLLHDISYHYLISSLIDQTLCVHTSL